MNLHIKTALLENEVMSYVQGRRAAREDALVCTAGSNPYGPSPRAVESLRNISEDQLCEYPHGDALQEAICSFLRPHAHIGKEQVVLTDGSIAGLYMVNCAFNTQGAALLALAPQFPDAISHARLMGIAYHPVFLRESMDYCFELERFLGGIHSGITLICLENPHNPTGQAMPLDALRAVLDKAEKYDIAVVADEAYGDFLPLEQSAVVLLSEYENLLVQRTFSKGFGLNGLRAGYLLAARPVAEALQKLSNPYTISQPARLAAAAALQDGGFLELCRERIASTKNELRARMGKNILMAYTTDTCPICLITHRDEAVDLSQAFLERGVATYSGVHFDGLGRNSVRLRVPHEQHAKRLYAAAEELNAIDTDPQ